VGTEPLAPVTDEFIGQLGSIPVHCPDPIALKNTLYQEFKIEIPVMVQNGKVYVRFSINAFNDEADLEKLEEALKILISRGSIQAQ
jgi:isopenicillin-N epimerase